MTHSPDFGAESRRRSVGCVFYFVPISGMHVPLRRPVIERNVLCTMSRLLIIITGIDEMDSSIFASSMLIFGVPDRISYKKSAPTFGAEIWTVCHRLYFSVYGSKPEGVCGVFTW